MNALVQAAWPLVTLVLGIVFIFVFRGPLSGLIARVRRVGKDGVEAYEPLPPPPAEEKKKAVEEFFKAFDNPLLLEAEQRIERDLRERNIVAPADRERALTRTLAAANILHHFEYVYGVIWHSQLACLRFLNPRGAGAPEQELRAFYDAAVQAFPNFYTNYRFENWLGFLGHMNLVRGEAGNIHITVMGREFLKYLVASAKPDPRHG